MFYSYTVSLFIPYEEMRRVELPSSFDKKTKQTLGAIFPLKFYNSFNLKYLKNGKYIIVIIPNLETFLLTLIFTYLSYF